ncbi:solute carrier family 25 member 51 isoform X1 [Trichoplusia ni]|uniref:Solute carrier family 25 member 51 isoform X1 n=1 Tax=Trichoplusia ni TaxID=7111 RepID=A0A7E5VDG3_TRINI|nr:solute carrier family 25 member 51 isoform X1 [Trichoplusia ni]
MKQLTLHHHTHHGRQKIMSCECDKKEMSEGDLLDRTCLGEGSVALPVGRAGLHQHWKEFVCGGGSAFCNILISYPLNKLIFRQMMHGVETTFALNQLQKEGLGFLYRGMLPPLMQRSLSMSLMFGVYDECLQPILERKVNPYVAKTFAGVVAGCVEATLMPFERLQTLLIHPKYHNKFRNTAHAASHIAKHYGIKEFYRGLVPILFRNGPSNAMFFVIRDEVRIRLPQQERAVYTGLQNFLAGATIGALLSTMFYPLNVIKIAMQCELGGPHRTVKYEFNYILRKRGSKFINFYHGAVLNISRAFLSWGIINASYEVFRKFLYS